MRVKVFRVWRREEGALLLCFGVGGAGGEEVHLSSEVNDGSIYRGTDKHFRDVRVCFILRM